MPANTEVGTIKSWRNIEKNTITYPKLLQKEVGSSNMNIGFTLFDRWFTFSPAKVRSVVCVLFVFSFCVCSRLIFFFRQITQ